ncbi:MAG: DUF6178 family protein [Planctomycetes bacterium]|nr:DUF6178 family protein [Planctomycetota bacterium]
MTQKSRSLPPDPEAVGGNGSAPLVARAKELLDLAKRDRRAAEAAFVDLGFEAQQETALALQGDELQEWLFLSEDCTDLVRSLPPEHLHRAIKLIGEEDALILLKAGSSLQLQAMMDIELFTDNRLDFKKMRRWVELLLELPEDEADEALAALDPNALATYLRRYVRPLVDKDNMLLALHLNQRYLFTPDDLECRDHLCERFVRYLYAVDRDLFGEALELLVGEEEDIVEADLYAAREDRLLRRGFPAVAAAEHLLELIDAAAYGVQWPKPKAQAAATGVALEHTGPAAPFLLHAMAWGRAKKALNERTERAFIKEAADLANLLLLAHTKDPMDPKVKHEALAAVQVLASIGLEAVTSGHLPAATEALKALELRELFQIGWSLAREVARDAWSMAIDSRISAGKLGRNLSWLPADLRSQVLEAEDYMSWREIAATARPGAEVAAEGRRPRELLGWPRLCRLREGVVRARAALEGAAESDAKDVL